MTRSLQRAAPLFALGFVLAYALSACGSGKVAGAVSDAAATRTTATATETTPTRPAATLPAVTVTNESTVTHATTATVQQTVATTVPAPVIVTPAATTAATTTDGGSNTSDSTGLWIVLAIGLGIGAIVVITRLLRDRRPAAAPVEVQRQQLFTVVESWKAQGWSIESEDTGEALLANGASRMIVHVDAEGRVSTHRLADA